ncbi:MAG: VWA domain-containing protein [Oscillospiraceae bacterium]|nr:VWA domain-containing protein [Oscillospiraceae bacterium]
MLNPKEQAINRWRLVLGRQSDQDLQFSGTDRELRTFQDMEELLDYLYQKGDSEDIRNDPGNSGNSGDSRKGSLDASQLTAAKWITKVRELFPRQTAEVLEKQALEEFHMTELLTDKKVLEQIQPDMDLLKTVLQLKHLMSGEVLETAKKIAQQVAEELRKKLENQIRRSILGRIDRNTSSPVRSARNLDMKKTIRKNLKNYDPESQQLILQDIYFSSRVKKYSNWRVIIAIDESGSMMGSVIYSAVMAQILAKLPFADVKLIIFDTSIVDLSGYAEEPAEILMSVQLGGGTDIGKAIAYCEQLIETPARTCVLCVTDLYEGAPEQYLLNSCRNILESGAKLNFLTALDETANPAYDRHLGQKLANMGAFVGALTPEQLGDYIGRMFSQ